MSCVPVDELLRAAREGARHAFLTRPGGTRYGAAVWTGSGRIHRSGQYSSFNHSTNIHAEMGALAVAAAAGDPDVLALALVSSAAIDSPARPCGVCRQVIAEHAKRVGRPIEVIMASWDGSAVERRAIDELLPSHWEPQPLSRDVPWIEPDPPSAEPPRFGDHLILDSRFAAIVWGFDPVAGRAWVKVKYDRDRKLPHSQSAWPEYQVELGRLGLGEPAPSGDRMVFVDPAACPRIPRAPVACVGVDRLRPALDLLPQPVFVTGSHAIGVARADSDVDLVMDRPLDDATRDRLCAAIVAGIDLAPPVGSSTWDRLERRTGRAAIDLVRDRRFCDTFMVRGPRGWSRVSLIWASTPDGPGAVRIDELRAGRTCGPMEGRVAEVLSRGKPTTWTFDGAAGSMLVQTWHKDGNLLRIGDRVAIAGVADAGAGRTLRQFSADRDFIRIEAKP